MCTQSMDNIMRYVAEANEVAPYNSCRKRHSGPADIVHKHQLVLDRCVTEHYCMIVLIKKDITLPGQAQCHLSYRSMQKKHMLDSASLSFFSQCLCCTPASTPGCRLLQPV